MQEETRSCMVRPHDAPHLRGSRSAWDGGSARQSSDSHIARVSGHHSPQVPPNPLLCDATRLQQSLLNCAANAANVTTSGHVVMQVALVQHCGGNRPGSMLQHCEVQDTGPGLGAATFARLFTPVEQADNATTCRHGGSGVGLAITANRDMALALLQTAWLHLQRLDGLAATQRTHALPGLAQLLSVAFNANAFADDHVR
jgi:Histidine kinase-, DNA gyrase B-, and HSP90-like ATPase